MRSKRQQPANRAKAVRRRVTGRATTRAVRGGGEVEESKLKVLQKLLPHVFVPSSTPQADRLRIKQELEELMTDPSIHKSAQPWKQLEGDTILFRGDTGDDLRQVVKFWDKPTNKGSYSTTTSKGKAGDFAGINDTNTRAAWFHTLEVPKGHAAIDIRRYLGTDLTDEDLDYFDDHDGYEKTFGQYKKYDREGDYEQGYDMMDEAMNMADVEREMLLRQPGWGLSSIYPEPSRPIVVHSRPTRKDQQSARTIHQTVIPYNTPAAPTTRVNTYPSIRRANNALRDRVGERFPSQYIKWESDFPGRYDDYNVTDEE